METKDRILETAEELFAARGYAATSLRSIISAAGVNLAAVHYHFRSKEALLEAVILRRAGPVNADRLALLERCESEAGGGPPKLEKILEAFIAPTFRVAEDPALGGPTFVRLMGRIHGEDEIFPNIIRNHFGHVVKRFADALRRALPEVAPDELFLKMQFAIGAMVQALMGTEALRAALDFGGPQPGSRQTLERLLEFTSAGFRARSTK